MPTKYKKWNVIEEHANRASELYAPLMRHGENPKRANQVIDDHLKIYQAQFIGKLSTNHLPNCRYLCDGVYRLEVVIKKMSHTLWVDSSHQNYEQICVNIPSKLLPR